MLSKWQLSYPLLRRLRWLVHVSGLLVLIALGYAGWRFHTSIQAWRVEMEQDIEQDQQTLLQATKIEEQLAEAMQSREVTSASFRALRDRVPSRLIDSDILKELERILTACNCKLLDFRPVGSQVINTTELKCQVRSFQLSMEGSYTGLFAFARQLDEFPFLIQLRKVHWVAPTESNSSSRIELEVGILFEPQWGESALVSVDRT
jgi:Tfp pilus assembly protein PilO